MAIGSPFFPKSTLGASETQGVGDASRHAAETAANVGKWPDVFILHRDASGKEGLEGF